MKRAIIALCATGVLFVGFAEGAPRYPLAKIEKIETEEKAVTSLLENKNFVDCDKVKIIEEDIRFALKHARPVSQRYFDEELVSMGCHGYGRVTFRNGDVLGVHLNPSGRVMLIPEKGRYAKKTFYYSCISCGDRLIERAHAK